MPAKRFRKFPNLKKGFPTKFKKASRKPNKLYKKKKIVST